MRDHRKLRAFELADELVVRTYAFTRLLPRDERFGLMAQVRRAAVSAASNIVEGCARKSQADYLHFLRISFGSLRELGYLSTLPTRLEMVDDSLHLEFKAAHDEASRVLAALIHSLEGERGGP